MGKTNLQSDRGRDFTVIRVLHLQGPSNWGGNLEGIRTLFNGLDRVRFEPVIGGPASSGYLARFQAEGFETIDIPMTKRWDVKGLHLLNQVLRKRNIHLIHSHVRLTDWLGGVASRWVGIPCVSTLHAPFQYTSDLQPLRDGTLPVYGWILRNLVDHVITVSDALRNDAIRILKLSPSHVAHVVNGVDPESFGSQANCEKIRRELGISVDRPVLMQVGWFGHRKGQMDMIYALHSVLKAVPDARCVFVGEGMLY